MSSPVADAWDSGLDVDRCKTPTLVEYLNDLDVLTRSYEIEYGTDEFYKELTERDGERVRLLKRLSAAPSGVMVKTLVSSVVKGQLPGECKRFDGSDPDYQFVYRFVNDLADRDPALVEKRTTAGSTLVTPTHRLLDLISEGITQTTGEGARNLYDRQFCETYLNTASEVSDRGRDLLEDSLQNYVDRIEDYQLLFDVTLLDRRGGERTDRMTKDYKTRFNDEGRIRKQWARFNQALEHGYGEFDNAVLVTLTTDPGKASDPDRPDPRSLWDMIRGPNGDDGISANWNRLLSYMDTDPTTIPDSRKESNPNYPAATGRPRDRPPYLKALEFTDKGYPHLHVLMFDVPTRESDGMPWLIDKQELSDKWNQYGQAQIVDLYPLTYRDDLDEIGNFGKKTLHVDADDGDGKEEIEVPVSEGFVDWYRYGDHAHGDEWVEEMARSHDVIDFYNLEDDDDGDDEPPMQKTAGAYLGKYLSATFGSLLEAAGKEESYKGDSYSDKVATWKLGLYWATNKRFWSVSRDIEKAIERHDHTQDPEVRDAIRYATTDSLALASRPAVLEHFARGRVTDLDDLVDRVDAALGDLMLPGIEASMPESGDFYAIIDYLGAFSYWDLPTTDATARSVETVEDFQPDAEYRSADGPKPPPVLSAWESDAPA